MISTFPEWDPDSDYKYKAQCFGGINLWGSVSSARFSLRLHLGMHHSASLFKAGPHAFFELPDLNGKALP